MPDRLGERRLRHKVYACLTGPPHMVRGPSADPSPQERVYEALRHRLPPSGSRNVGLLGQGIVFAVIVGLACLFAVAAGHPGLVPSVVAFSFVGWVLFVAFQTAFGI